MDAPGVSMNRARRVAFTYAVPIARPGYHRNVSISLDGVGDAHDVQRQFKNGKGSFAWVNRTLDRLIARGIKPFISITVSNRNTAELADVIRYVVERARRR